MVLNRMGLQWVHHCMGMGPRAKTLQPNPTQFENICFVGYKALPSELVGHVSTAVFRSTLPLLLIMSPVRTLEKNKCEVVENRTHDTSVVGYKPQPTELLSRDQVVGSAM